MTTKLDKTVVRVSTVAIRDGGKMRNLVVAMYPGGVIGIRPQGTRREEFATLEGVYSTAVMRRVAAEKAAKKAAKKR